GGGPHRTVRPSRPALSRPTASHHSPERHRRARRPRTGCPGDSTKELSMATISRRTLFTAATGLTTAAGVTALGTSHAAAGPPGPSPLPDPTFTEVSVHDPSVIVTDGRFYVFGSHLAAARS